MTPADVLILVFVGYWVSYLLGFVAMVILDHDLRYLHWLEECPIPILPQITFPLWWPILAIAIWMNREPAAKKRRRV